MYYGGKEKEVVYSPVKLSMPNKPVLPKISSDELSCLSNETKVTLLARDKLQKGYIIDLESVIEGNNATATKSDK